MGKARSTVAAAELTAAGFPADAEYREATDPAFACGACEFYKDGTCSMFEVDVEADNVCDYFASVKGEENEPADLTLAAAADEPAEAPAECAECSHMADDHMGGEGACQVDDCACAEYAAADVEPDDDDDEMVVHLTAGDFSTLTEGLAPTQAALVRVRLASLALVADAVALPEQHQPGERLPEPHPSPEAPPAALPRNGEIAWTALFVPEGVLTDDGRAMAPGSIGWRDLPLTLMAMIETSEGGHVGAEVCGRIDAIWRDDEAGVIRASGVFGSTDYAAMIATMVDNKELRGVSVDLAIHEFEVGPRSDYFDDDGNWSPQEKSDDDAAPGILDLLFGPEEGAEPTVFVVTKAVIGMCTVCPFPAFADASIEVANSLVAGANPAIVTVTAQGGFTLVERPRVGEATREAREGIEVAPGETAVLSASGDVVTASAAGLVPVQPPASWFSAPELDELTPLSVDDNGRVYGHAWAWGFCHTGFPDACVTAPRSTTGYAYFHLGEVECEEGERISVGHITLDTGHADKRLGRAAAAAHYDNTGTVVADIVVGEDEFGGWVAGALRPDVDAEQARKLMAATLSGDWRKVNDSVGLELVALLAVNVPGFPVPRTRALVAAGEGEREVLSLVAAGVHLGMPAPETLTEEQRARLDELLMRAQGSHDEFAERFAELAARAKAA